MYVHSQVRNTLYRPKKNTRTKKILNNKRKQWDNNSSQRQTKRETIPDHIRMK